MYLTKKGKSLGSDFKDALEVYQMLTIILTSSESKIEGLREEGTFESTPRLRCSCGDLLIVCVVLGISSLEFSADVCLALIFTGLCRKKVLFC